MKTFVHSPCMEVWNYWNISCVVMWMLWFDCDKKRQSSLYCCVLNGTTKVFLSCKENWINITEKLFRILSCWKDLGFACHSVIRPFRNQDYYHLSLLPLDISVCPAIRNVANYHPHPASLLVSLITPSLPKAFLRQHKRYSFINLLILMFLFVVNFQFK